VTLTAERLRELLDYDPLTGVFVWRKPRQRVRVGQVAGKVWADRNGIRYRVIGVEQVQYLAHRLVWLYVHGIWPAEQIDHIDHDGLNNAIHNLRDVSATENLRSRRWKQRRELHGLYWCAEQSKWRVRVHFNGRRQHVGYFNCKSAAIKAHADARQVIEADRKRKASK
jgi:hypothetical protein